MTQQDIDKFLERQLSSKERAFNAGCLGALTDVIKLCHDCSAPLPKWASTEISKALGGLMVGDKERINGWSAWLRRYRQDMSDYEIYEEVLQARKYGAEWADAYDIAASSLAGRISETQTQTVKKAYTRAKKRMESEPYRYHVLSTVKGKSRGTSFNAKAWDWIRTTIKSGNPRKNSNNDDLV